MANRILLAILLVVSILSACAAPAPTPIATLESTPEASAPEPTITPEPPNTATSQPTEKPTQPPAPTNARPPNTPTLTPPPVSTEVISTPDEVLIGTDFIALPKEIIEEMLKKEGNENKAILPAKPDKNTRIVFRPMSDTSPWVYLDLYDLTDRNVYNPTDGEVVLRPTDNKKGGGFIDTGIPKVEFLFGTTENNPLPDQPQTIKRNSLGKVLYTGAVERTTLSNEKKGIISVGLYIRSGLSAAEIRQVFENDVLLVFKGRLVVLQ